MEQDTIEHRSKCFCYYFLRTFEDKILMYLDILEGEPNPDVPTSSIPGKGASGAAGAVPYVGKALSILASEADKIILSRIQKKNSKKLATFVYSYRDQKDIVRMMLLECALKIFMAFEEQFSKVSTDGGPHRAMQKLAVDSVHRYIMYHLENPELDITTNSIIKGVLLGTSMSKLLGITKPGRALVVNEKEWKTSKVFTKVGVCIKDTTKVEYYCNEDTSSQKYGYRLLFEHEDPEIIKEVWEISKPTETPYKYQLNMENFAVTSKECWEYYLHQYPLDELKHEMERANVEATEDRQGKLDELLEDNKEKHEEATVHRGKLHESTIEAMQISKIELMEMIASSFQQISMESFKNNESAMTLMTDLHQLTNANISTTKEELKQQIVNIATSTEDKLNQRDPLSKLVYDIKNKIEELKEEDWKNHPDVKNVMNAVDKVKNVRESGDGQKIEEEVQRIGQDLRNARDKVKKAFRF